MKRVKVVKSSGVIGLENKINTALKEIHGEIVDIKVSGAYDGSSECFIAVIIFENK